MMRFLNRLALTGRKNAFLRDEKGLGAIEFAIIVPLMVTMYLGAVEFGHALTIDRRVTSTASATADLVAQVEQVNDADIADIFAAATSILSPYNTAPLSIVVSSVYADENNDTKVRWSESHNGTAHAPESAYSLPPGLTQPFSSVIVAEVSYTYDPPVGQFLTGGVTMSETFYLKPRRSLEVEKL